MERRSARQVFSAALAVSFAFALHGAEIYKTTEPDGTVRYSDLPDGKGAKWMGRSSGDAATAPQSEQAGPSSTPAASEDKPPSSEEIRVALEDFEAQKRQNCKIATDQLTRFMSTDRLFKPNKDGTQSYLSKDEVADVRQRAQAEADRWCS